MAGAVTLIGPAPAAWQSYFEGTLTGTATVLRRSHTPDGAGGSTDSWPTVATVPARAHRRRGQEFRNDVGWRALSGWVVALPLGTDAGVHDRIQVGSTVIELTDVLPGEGCLYAFGEEPK